MFTPLMKGIAYIILVSLLALGANPIIRQVQVPVEQTAACCDACCCDAPSDACTDHEGDDQEEDKDRPCKSTCDCCCQFHLNALHFNFNNMQLAEEQEYFYGEYHNEYSFEYSKLHIHPPRFA